MSPADPDDRKGPLVTLREYAAVGSFMSGALGLVVTGVSFAFDLPGSVLPYLGAGLVLPVVGYFLWPYR